MSKVPILRVTQMNAIYFDKEIYKIFLEHMQDCLKELHPLYAATYSKELNLLMKYTIFWFSIWKCNSTFGQKLLSTQYDNITVIKKVVLAIGLFGEYILDKVETLQNGILVRLGLTKINDFIQLCRFLNISVFLRNGMRPRLMERVSSLDLSYSSTNMQRQYDSQYMTRELLWNSFIEMLLYIVPLINYHKVKRTVRSLNPFHKKRSCPASNMPYITANTKCPHCNEFPIIPHHMGCAHVFCYSCLKGNQIADSKYECALCGYTADSNICEKVS